MVEDFHCQTKYPFLRNTDASFYTETHFLWDDNMRSMLAYILCKSVILFDADLLLPVSAQTQLQRKRPHSALSQ